MKIYKYLICVLPLLNACGADEKVNEDVTVQELVEVVADESNDTSTIEQPIVEVLINPSVITPTLTRVTVESGMVQLSWKAVKNATSYNVYFNEGDDVDIDSMSFNSTVNKFNHEPVGETLHSYRIQAVAGDASSELSYKMQADFSKSVESISDSSDFGG